ncbi:hypothetical protein KC332_g8276 [Hortaea werneckii]|nr:hypothetical protein KC350_g6942 [Hortaea werneckii]KAI6847033.1 hypothetical protein KC358_g2543 [Hortaea werneckii]KAI6927026.1 hypothetical protein KC348_g8507 [Hortaea werneckii]KAI6934888.1 hypothetical protein KC341_g7309 [Hortaea werneckii]KAI6968635.1 hypothetical protein KC321_g8352 [Hortaea werneckii]
MGCKAADPFDDGDTPLPTKRGFLEALKPIKVDSIPADDKGNHDDCSICLEQYGESGSCQPTRLRCGHYYGIECLKKWYSKTQSNICPKRCTRELFQNDDAVPTAADAVAPTIDRNDTVNLDRLRRYILDSGTDPNSPWSATSGSFEASENFRIRSWEYQYSGLDVDRDDYTAYQRQNVKYATGLPREPRTLNRTRLARQVECRFWTALDQGMKKSSSSTLQLSQNRVQYPLEAHPLVWQLKELICVTLRRQTVRHLTATKLEQQLYGAVWHAQGLGDLRRRSMLDSGDLPRGMYAFVLDILEDVIVDFLAAGAPKGIAILKGGMGKPVERRVLY